MLPTAAAKGVGPSVSPPSAEVPLSVTSHANTQDPVALFTARHDRMRVDFDARASYSPGGGALDSYAWDFGDGGTAMGALATHTYATPGRYTVTLAVADAQGRLSNTTRLVSPSSTTVDILVDQLFEAGCPYSPYWDIRGQAYGDALLSNQVPCSNYYPWIYYSSSPALQLVNPSWIYTMYRYDARVRNHSGYDLWDPVILPVLNPSVAPVTNSFLRFDLGFEYMTGEVIDASQGTSLPISPALNDGYGYLVQGSLTMDLTTSKRIFWVNASTPDEARAWWAANTVPRSYIHGIAELNLDRWLVVLGDANGKYDIFNGYEWWVQTDITDLSATVADDGTTTLEVFMTGWGYEALLMRWWYWGEASYREAVNLPYAEVQPAGWAPWEMCWCEHSTMNGTITTGLDPDYRTIGTYHFMAWANWGQDGIPRTVDDLPAWVFAPYLMDYVPRAGSGSPARSGYPNSELRWYEGRTSVHGTPGSYAYAQPYEYVSTPARMPLEAGTTLTISLPDFSVKWYDPVGSKWNPEAKIGDYVTFDAPMSLRRICDDPDRGSTCSTATRGTYHTWDRRGKVISLAGPHDWGATDLPRQPSPWIEFAPDDSTPPSLSITAPSPGALLPSADLQVAWAAADYPSGIGRFEVSLDGAPPIVLPAGTSRYAFVGVSDGLHSIRVTAFDASGNAQSASVDVAVDTTGPALSFLTPEPGVAVRGDGLTLEWSSRDDTSGLVSLELRVDNGAATELLATARSYTVSGLAEGSHTFTLRAVDGAGNAAIVIMTVTIDNTSPTLVFGAPAAGAVIDRDTVEVTWVASDGGSGLGHLEIRLDDGAVTRLPADATHHTLTGLPDGQHRIELTAVDKAGNARTVATEVTVEAAGSEAPLRIPGLGTALGIAVLGVVGGVALGFILGRRRRR